jgi:hypothetical protein
MKSVCEGIPTLRRAVSKTLRSDMFLPFDICPSYHECETAKCRIIEFVILEDSLKRTAFPAMIQLHFSERGWSNGTAIHRR